MARIGLSCFVVVPSDGHVFLFDDATEIHRSRILIDEGQNVSFHVGTFLLRVTINISICGARGQTILSPSPLRESEMTLLRH